MLLAVLTIMSGAFDEGEMICGAVNVMTQELQQALDLLQCWWFPDALFGGLQKVL